MKLGIKVKEKIARTIADYFTTNEIVTVFTDANIPTDKSLYAKWRITLDAFNKTTADENIFLTLEQFCHPLNFENREDKKTRQTFINALKKILSYENIEIYPTEKDVQFVSDDGRYKTVISSKSEPKAKTSTDYVIEAINFFKNEYNKVRMSGLIYEYSLGENITSDQFEDGREGYSERLQAIEQLKNVGLITEYKIVDKVEDEGYYLWDYAVCKIDESKITQKEAPPATDAGVEALTKIIHEHTHRFENSIQEKEIDLNHKFPEEEVLVKNKKKIALPKFPPTDWSKAEIRFIDENTVYIKADKKTATADYEGLGFRNDKNGKPNTAWHFLFGLAKRNGETLVIKSPVPDNIKQQKRTLSDRLKTIFKNDTDPFYDFSQANTYKIKIKLLPPVEEKTSDKVGVGEYFEETMTSERESEE